MNAVAEARIGEALLWVLAAYGFVLILTGSYLFEPLRRRAQTLSPTLGHFLRCPMCVGFWIGAFLSRRYSLGLASRVLGLVSLETMFLDALATSAICWSIHVVLAHLGAEEL